MISFIVVSLILAVAFFVVGTLAERKNGLIARAQKGEQAALDAIRAKLNLK